MAVRIQDPSNVFITDPDTGKEHNAGQIMDVIRNWPGEASNVQVALAEWWASQKAKHRNDIKQAEDAVRATVQADNSKTFDEAATRHAKELEKRDKAHASALQIKEEKINELTAEKIEKQSLIDALGGTEQAKQLRKQQRKEALMAELASLEE